MHSRHRFGCLRSNGETGPETRREGQPRMRALGPGSVSSFLKIILDVVYVALSITAVLVALGLAGFLVFTVDPDIFGLRGALGAASDAVTKRPLLLGQTLSAALY